MVDAIHKYIPSFYVTYLVSENVICLTNEVFFSFMDLLFLLAIYKTINYKLISYDKMDIYNEDVSDWRPNISFVNSGPLSDVFHRVASHLNIDIDDISTINYYTNVMEMTPEVFARTMIYAAYLYRSYLHSFNIAVCEISLMEENKICQSSVWD